MFYDLATLTWGEEELAAIQRVVSSGRLTMGTEVETFEKEFAKYFSMRYAVMVNSGSSANLISTAAMFYKRERPLEHSDEAVVPAISWSTTYHPLQQYGLKLRFVDVELETLNIDARAVEDALTPHTRLLVGVSILGNPAALDMLRNLADRHGLYFLEDNCESLDAELHGRKTGTFGDLCTFSFYYSHQISTMEGGMVLTNDKELYHLLLALRAHGWTRDLPSDSPFDQHSRIDSFEQYRFVLPGYNVRPLEISGAIGREQLKKLPEMTRRRRENWALFQRLFGNDPRFITQRENGLSSCFSFAMILNPQFGIQRQRVFSALREADIGFRMITGGCFPCHDVIKYYNYSIAGAGSLLNAELAHYNGFFVGNYPFDLTLQLTRLWEVLDYACR